jgi:signal transduction histidine kinase
MLGKTRAILHERVGRLIGPYSASLTVGLWVLIPLTLGTAFSDAENHTGIQAAWIVTAIQAFVLALVFFSVGGLVANRFKAPRARTAAFLTLFALTEAVRSVAVTILAYQAGAIDSINWSFRILAGVLTGIAAFSVVSIVVNEVFSFREKLNELTVQRARLTVLQNRSEQELTTVRAEALRDVRDRVDEAIRSLTMATATAPESTSARSVVAALIEVSDNVIRPLSHQLMLEPRTLPNNDVALAPTPLRRGGAGFMVDFITRVEPIRPRSLPVMLFLLGFGAAATLLPYGIGIPILMVWLTVMGLILTLAVRIVGPHLERWSVATRIVVVSLLNGLVAVGAGLSAALPAGYHPDQLVLTLVYTTVVFNGVAWAIAVPPGLREAHRQIISETETINARLAWKVSRDNSLLWAEQKQLSRTLHQEIQGTLIAAAFRLQRDIEAGVDPARSLADVRELITAAAFQSVSPGTVHELTAGLEEIRNRWAGVIALTWNCDDALIRRIDDDIVTRRIIFDLLAEFITNSIKHGHAKNAAVSIVELTDDSVHLSLTNDGAPLSVDAQPGLGTRLAQNVGLFVGYAPRTEGIEFHLDLTLAPDATRV